MRWVIELGQEHAANERHIECYILLFGLGFWKNFLLKKKIFFKDQKKVLNPKICNNPLSHRAFQSVWH